jgi:hypothetical protein
MILYATYVDAIDFNDVAITQSNANDQGKIACYLDPHTAAGYDEAQVIIEFEVSYAHEVFVDYSRAGSLELSDYLLETHDESALRSDLQLNYLFSEEQFMTAVERDEVYMGGLYVKNIQVDSIRRIFAGVTDQEGLVTPIGTFA